MARFSRLAVVVAFAALMSGHAYGQCTPPGKVEVTSNLIKAVKTLSCSSISGSEKIDAVIEYVPFSGQLAFNKNECSGLQSYEQEAYRTTREYLATPDSILIAECGYRACQLVAAGGNNTDALSILGAVCGTGVSHRSKDKQFRLVSPIIEVRTDDSRVVKKDSSSSVALQANVYNPGAALKLAKPKHNDQKVTLLFSGQGSTVDIASGPRVVAVPITVSWPNELNQSKEPYDIPFELEGTSPNESLAVTGRIRIVPPLPYDTMACTRPERGLCRACVFTSKRKGVDQIPEHSDGFYVACAGMPPKTRVVVGAHGPVQPALITNPAQEDPHVVVTLVVDSGAQPNAKTDAHWYQNRNPNKLDVPISVQTTTVVPDDGVVRAHLLVGDVATWPATEGPLKIQDDFKIVMEVMTPDQLDLVKSMEQSIRSLKPPK
jgi:hypothetical protein